MANNLPFSITLSYGYSIFHLKHPLFDKFKLQGQAVHSHAHINSSFNSSMNFVMSNRYLTLS